LNPAFIGLIDWDLVKAHINDVSLSGADVKGVVDSVVTNKASIHISNLKMKNKSKKSFSSFSTSDIINHEVLPPPIDTESFIKAFDSLESTGFGPEAHSYKIGFSSSI
jgi:hypothetical protein